MSAVEEIQAAIEKLTKLKAESTEGPWVLVADEHYADRVVDKSGKWLIGDASNYSDAPLIVTLHATIDAQLSLLRDGLNWKSAESYAATLAIAINGATS